jgi:hypothetical protein
MPLKERERAESYLRPGQRRAAAATRVATPPPTDGVANDRGYQEDQPRDKASAVCCALLRPDPPRPQPTSGPRQPRSYGGKARSDGG